MKTIIYYLSGTGNSLKLTKDLAKEMGNVSIKSIASVSRPESDFDCVGLVFPVYAWGIPQIVSNFCRRLKTDKYTFTVINYASNPGYTMEHVKLLLKLNGIRLSFGYGIPMPDNFIPLVNAYPKSKQTEIIESAEIKTKMLASIISKQEEQPISVDIGLKNYFLSHVGNKLCCRVFKYTDSFFGRILIVLPVVYVKIFARRKI